MTSSSKFAFPHFTYPNNYILAHSIREKRSNEETFVNTIENWADDIIGGTCLVDDNCKWQPLVYCKKENALLPGECSLIWWFIMVLVIIALILIVAVLACCCAPCCCLYACCHSIFCCCCD